MSKKQAAARLLANGIGIQLLDSFWGKKRLTVLAYHRIIEYEHANFADYVPVVSATPTIFEQQMQFVEQYFNVISLTDLYNAMTKNAPLPDRPLLITFDDGYLDNYENAYPILKKFNFPAVIFLTTSRMADPSPLWWDQVARYFHHTHKQDVNLPLIGEQSLTGESKPHILDNLLRELKKIPEDEKLDAVENIRQVLDVTDPDKSPLFMNWDQVRDLVNNGIACQTHTLTHPIMTRISPEEVRRQLSGARDAIAAETNQEIVAFAYPNGTHADYSMDTMAALQETGYTMAFTLEPGPMRWDAVKQHPLQIRRVYLGYHDTFEVFKVKVMGVPALNSVIAFPQAST